MTAVYLVRYTVWREKKGVGLIISTGVPYLITLIRRGNKSSGRTRELSSVRQRKPFEFTTSYVLIIWRSSRSFQFKYSTVNWSYIKSVSILGFFFLTILTVIFFPCLSLWSRSCSRSSDLAMAITSSRLPACLSLVQPSLLMTCC